MASCVRNIRIKNYKNLIIGFQVTVENVGDVYFGTVYFSSHEYYSVCQFVLYEFYNIFQHVMIQKINNRKNNKNFPHRYFFAGYKWKHRNQ